MIRSESAKNLFHRQRNSLRGLSNSQLFGVGNLLKPLRRLHETAFDPVIAWRSAKNSLQNSLRVGNAPATQSEDCFTRSTRPTAFLRANDPCRPGRRTASPRP